MIDAGPTHAASLADFLQYLDPKLRRIGDAQSYERIHEIGRRFPGTAFYCLGFERPMNAHYAGLDFSLNLSPSGAAHALATYAGDTAAAIASGVAYIPNTDAMWLEFDTSAAADAGLSPNVFIPFQREISPNSGEYDGLTEFIRHLPPSLGLTARPLEKLKRCLECAPSSVERIFVGFMLGRRSRAVRLNLMPFFRISDACEFLGAVGWTGSLDRVREILEPYATSIDLLTLHLDLSGPAHASAGFELYAADLHESPPERDRRWEGLFDRLVECGLCIPDVRRQLLDWSSQTVFDAPLVERLIRAAHPSSERLLYGTLQTAINDVKISFGADGRALAKAYFGAFLEE